MIVFMSGERQAKALYRVAQEQDWPVMGLCCLKGLNQRGQVMPTQIAHER